MIRIKEKKYFVSLFILVLIIIPQVSWGDDIIPCTNECDFEDLLQLINNIISWVIKISIPVAAGVFAWAGFTYMTTGISDKKSQAKAMLRKVFIGFVIILSAWLIVSTVLDALLADRVRKTIEINK